PFVEAGLPGGRPRQGGGEAGNGEARARGGWARGAEVQNGGASSAVARAVAFFAGAFLAAAFLVAFFAAFFAGAFLAGAFFGAASLLAAVLVAAFLATAFFAPKPRRAGLPVSASSCCTSSRVSVDGSRSLGILPLSLPSLMYGPKRPLSTWMSLPGNSLMIRLRAISSFSSISSTARARSILYGSSSFFSEA